MVEREGEIGEREKKRERERQGRERESMTSNVKENQRVGKQEREKMKQ